jgi:hypothetical protein
MALQSCPECGRPLSDVARRCPKCGNALEPVAAAPYPYDPRPAASLPWERSPRTRVPVRLAQGGCVLICLLLGLITTPPAEDSYEMLGQAIGVVVGPLLFGALFLGWSRRTRPFTPVLAAGFALVAALGNAGREMERAGLAQEERTREETQRKLLVKALMDDSAGTGAAGLLPDGGAAPPQDDQAALTWALNRVLADAPAHRREVAARHGIDPEKPPAAWATPRYTASASAHPEVERYWEGYRAFLADYRQGAPGWIRAQAAEHIRWAGVEPDMSAGFMEGMEEMAGRVRNESIERADSVAAVALEIHRFLVSVDARVSYDAKRDMALFDSDADLRRVNRLDRRLKAASDAMDRAKEERRARLTRGLESTAADP